MSCAVHCINQWFKDLRRSRPTFHADRLSLLTARSNSETRWGWSSSGVEDVPGDLVNLQDASGKKLGRVKIAGLIVSVLDPIQS
jgi:hypothetical protein